MTAASPPKRAKSAKRLRRFFRGISAALSLPRIWLDSTPGAAAGPSQPGKQPVCDRGSIPCGNALTVPRRNRPLHLSKRHRAKFACLGYNSGLWSPQYEEILGAWVNPYPFLEISREDAGTGFTNVDGRNVRPEAKAAGAKALSVCADAGAAVPLQFGLRWVRQNPISRAHLENGLDPGGMLQGRGRVRHADGFDSRRGIETIGVPHSSTADGFDSRRGAADAPAD